MKKQLIRALLLAAVVVSCPAALANIFFKNATQNSLYLEIYDPYGTCVGYFEPDPGWLSLGNFPSGYSIIGYDWEATTVLFEETPYPEESNWELEFIGPFETSWTYLGTGVRLLGYSRNIVGQKDVAIPLQNASAAPFNGFFGDSAISAIEWGLPYNTRIDGYYVWQGEWVNGVVPYLSAGQIFQVEASSDTYVYWRGDVYPGPGESSTTIIPQTGLFATTLPLIDEYSGISPQPYMYVYDAYQERSFTYSPYSGWHDSVSGAYTPDIKLSAGRAYYVSAPNGNITWTQQNPEHYPRHGDMYITLDDQGTITASGGTPGYKVTFFKPKIRTQNWLFAGSTSYYSDSMSVGSLLSTFGNEGFFQMIHSDVDNDLDQVPDWWEVLKGSDPGLNDSNLDPDRNGRSNYQEYCDAGAASAQSLGFSVYNINQGAKR